MIEALLADIVDVSPDDRLFTRYLLLTNHYNAGVCSADLAGHRLALAEATNLLSRSPTIALPTAIDAAETIYRIDIRDYDWNRDISVEGVSFVDLWEGIVARSSPYAVPYVGDDADDLVAFAGTSVPMLTLAALIETALAGPLYYPAIGLDRDRGIDDFLFSEFGIANASVRAPGVMAAGYERRTTGERGSSLVARLPVTTSNRYFWQQQNAPEVQGGGLLANPFGFAAEETLMLFSLPNALSGYASADALRLVADDSNVTLDLEASNFRARVAVSCARCHAAGLLPVEDAVRAYVDANSISYPPAEVADVRANFPLSAALAQQMGLDNTARRAALDLLSIPIGSSDPVYDAWARFDADLRLEDAAGDLGLTPGVLRSMLGDLDDTLAILANGLLDRDDFEAVFKSSLCFAEQPSENQPSADYCQTP